MIGALIGGALSLGSSIIGGIAARKNAKKAEQEVDKQLSSARAWYDYNNNQDYTQRADAQASVNRAREIMLERSKQAAAAKAVAGGSDEAEALAKEQANQVVADAASGVAQQAAAFKDANQQQMQSAEQSASQQRQAIYTGQANNASQAASQGIQAGANIMAADADFLNKGLKKK